MATKTTAHDYSKWADKNGGLHADGANDGATCITLDGGSTLNVRTTFNGVVQIEDDGVKLTLRYFPPAKDSHGDWNPTDDDGKPETVITIEAPAGK